MSTCGVSQYNTSSVTAPLHPIEIPPPPGITKAMARQSGIYTQNQR